MVDQLSISGPGAIGRFGGSHSRPLIDCEDIAMSSFDPFSRTGLGSMMEQAGYAMRVTDLLRGMNAAGEIKRQLGAANAAIHLKDLQTAALADSASEFSALASREAARLAVEYTDSDSIYTAMGAVAGRSGAQDFLTAAAAANEAMAFALENSVDVLRGFSANEAQINAAMIAADYIREERSAIAEASSSLAAIVQEYQGALGAFQASALETADLMSRHHGAIAAAFAGSQTYDHVSQLVASLSEELRFVSLAGQSLAPDYHTFLRDYSDLLGEALFVAEELEEADAPEERERLVGALSALITYVARFSDSDLGKFLLYAMAVFGTVGTIINFIPRETTPGLSVEQANGLEEMRDSVRELKRNAESYQATARALSEAYAANLPRAEVKRKAVIRASPGREGLVLYKMPAGTSIAIIQTEGRWKEIAYRDPLTNRLFRGWVYGASVSM